jgi:ABC-type glycerol-3-phosphate transport system substrate-binding protein
VHKRLPIVLALLIVSALALAACGGGDDEGEVEEVVEVSATTTDPADCKGLQTQEFMEQISRESGVAAVEACEEEAKNEEGADAVEVSAIEVDGSDATAEAALEGGALDGQTVEVALIKDGDQWKMNEVVKFTDFDHTHLAEGLEKQLSDASEGEAKFAGCFVEAFKQASEAEVEELIFGKSPQALEEVFEACSSRPGA